MKFNHWSDIYAAKIIKEKGQKDTYVCASGITPSGTVHIGNFREVISVDLIVRALRHAGHNVKFIYSWDNYDVLRKVPSNMPNSNLLEKHLRQAITKVPDTNNQETSYARKNEVEFEKYLPTVGIFPIFINQSKKYMNSEYKDQIKLALDHRKEIMNILNRYRTTDLKTNWMPLNVFCTKCNKDTTEITEYDKQYSIKYECECENSENLDLRKTGAVKLPWRIDWPMRWKYERVDFEPAGKDHHSSGGSFETAKEIVKIFNGEAPVTFQYDFISIKGLGGKISSSSGEVVSLKDVLEIYTPELVRFLFVSTKPNIEFSISFDLDVIKIYEDYDKFEKIYYGLEPVKENKKEVFKRIYELSQINELKFQLPYQIGFRHLTVIVQIFEGNKDKILKYLKDVKEHQKEKLIRKIDCAINWIKDYAPLEFKFSLRKDEKNLNPLSQNEKIAIINLLEFLETKFENITEKNIQDEIYNIARNNNIEPPLFFRIIYIILINQEKGPKLASFIKTIGIKQLQKIIKYYL